MKVLVIEDDPSLREIICRSLEKERYVTEEAPDFQTALEKTADYTYDCILLDIIHSSDPSGQPGICLCKRKRAPNAHTCGTSRPDHA